MEAILIIKAGSGDLWLYAKVYDLERHQLIDRVVSIDSDAGEVEIYELGEENSLYPIVKKEKRRFSVIDVRDYREICRTN